MPIVAYLVAWFARDRVAALAGVAWRAFCAFVSNPIGAAIVAGAVCLVVGYGRGDLAGRHVVHAQWAAANARVERERVDRDAQAKARAEAEVKDRIAAAEARAAQAEGKLDDYAANLAAHPIGACAYTADDVRRLLDLKHDPGNPVARRFGPFGVRAGSRAGQNP